ncbi:MAG: hypothetical protein LC798_03180 [Chloroflexi bacterium]|nr:hypothetical protein [Chloroflexota bacterium]
MSDTPSLRRIEDALERIAELVPTIAEAARWAWPLGYERRAGERSAGSRGSVSYPTESAVGTEQTIEWQVRHEVRRAGTWIMQVAVLLEATIAALERVGKLMAKQENSPVERPEVLAKTATRAEVEHARQTKARRDSQRPKGTGYGTY